VVYWLQSLNMVKKNTDALFDATKKVVLEVNKTECMFMSYHHTAKQNHS
jgi:hypothetical protein